MTTTKQYFKVKNGLEFPSQDTLSVTTSTGPSIRPSLNLDFANSKVLDGRITFSRGSEATLFRPTGQLRNLYILSEPRISYNPATGECLGLLLESSSTNLLTYSADLSVDAWTYSGASIGPGPAGSGPEWNTPYKISEDSTTGHHIAYYSIPPSTMGVNTFSIFVKAAERTAVAIQIYEFNPTPTIRYVVVFDLLTGTMTSSTSFSTPTNTTYSITPIKDGWYRCSVTMTTNSAAGVSVAPSNSTTPTWSTSYMPSYAGAIGSGIYVCGAQLEARGYPTSYIYSDVSQTTRNGDEAYVWLDSSWFTWNEGTIYVELIPLELGIGSGVTIDDGTESNQIQLAATSTTEQMNVTTGGMPYVSLDAGTPTVGVLQKMAMRFKDNDFALSVNGSAAVVDTNGIIDNNNSQVYMKMWIGGTGTVYGNVYIKKVTYYPKALTNTELTALTS